MKFYALKFGLNAGTDQTQITNLIQANGGEVIQTSDGLCVKSLKSETELKKLLVSALEGVTLQTLDPAKVKEDANVPVDIKNFVGG